MPNVPNASKGFTLVELMVVVAIIGILAAIAIPAYNAYRLKAYNGTALHDLRNLMTAEEAEYASNQQYTAESAGLGPAWLFGHTKHISTNVGYVINTANSNTAYAAFTGHKHGDTEYGADTQGAIRKKSVAAPALAAQGETTATLSGWGGGPL